jgi:hypothetical protein
MVRVWFGDESQGLRRDRQEYVMTLERPCRTVMPPSAFIVTVLAFMSQA